MSRYRKSVIVQALHREYHALDRSHVRELRVMLDGRGGVDGSPLRALGVNVINVARPPGR